MRSCVALLHYGAKEVGLRLLDGLRRDDRDQPRAEFVRLGPAGADLAHPGVILKNDVLQAVPHDLLDVA